MTSIAINIILFKLGWLACVISAAKGVPGAGMVAVAAVVAIHLSSARSAHKSAMLLVSAALIGLMWESVLASAGWLDYGPNAGPGPLAPFWIVGMWVLFATTLNLGFRWLKGRFGLAAVFGAIGGPLAFFGGAKLGAVSFSDPVWTPIVIAVGWALLMPLMVYLSRHFDGHHHLQQDSDAQLVAVPADVSGDR